MLPLQGPGSSVPFMRGPPGSQARASSGSPLLRRRARAARPPALGAERAFDIGRGARRGARRRRRPHLHAQPPARPARRGRARRRQARDLREADRARRATAPSALTDAADGRRAGSPPCRSSTATTRPSARRASACARATAGPLRLIHGSYLQDWLLRPEDDNWRVEAELGGASRAFADIGSHWCDLAEFVSGHRITRLCARTLTAAPRARHERGARGLPGGQRPRRGARRRHRGRGARAVRDRSAARSARRSSARSPPAARTASGSSSTAREEALAFNQEEPESLWVGRREAATLIKRDPEHAVRCRRSATRRCRAGHPQGYADCFDAFVAEVYAAVDSGETARRPAGRSRTACAPRGSPTPC